MTNPYNPEIPFTSRKVNDLHPSMQLGLMQAIDLWNRDNRYPDVIITCTYRSPAQQDILFEQGRTTPGPKVTWTRNSKHNEYPALAFDIAFVKADKSLDWNPNLFKMFARTVGAMIPGLVWGGNWKTPDAPHFEI